MESIAGKLSDLMGEKRVILAIVASCAILTYGGISLAVVVFAIYPIAKNLFQKANVNRRIIPATIALGAFTFTMSALPGTPQIQNLIPTTFFHTTTTAAPVMGISASVIMAVLGYSYLVYRQKKLAKAGEVYIGEDEKPETENNEKPPNFILSILPLAVVIFSFNILDIHIITALVTVIILILVINYSKFKSFPAVISAGAKDSLMAIMNTSAAVGFGAVVISVPAFIELTDILSNIPGSPLISLAITVNLLAGATGSASGGLSIALTAIGEQYYQTALQQGISPEAFHRVASIASGGLDLLPHNGAILTLLTVTGLSHKESYKDIFIATVIIPLIALVAVIILAFLGIY